MGEVSSFSREINDIWLINLGKRWTYLVSFSPMSFSFISYCEKKICAHLKIDDFLFFTAINFISAHFLNREPEKHRSGLDFWYKHVQVIFHIQNLRKFKHVILSQYIMLFSCSPKNSERNNSKLQNVVPLLLGCLWFILVM